LVSLDINIFPLSIFFIWFNVHYSVFLMIMSLILANIMAHPANWWELDE
jgi:hypothetical protein